MLVESAIEAKVTRAIEARYSAAATAERRAALAASKAAHAPRPSAVGWNERPTEDDAARERKVAAERSARLDRRTKEDKRLGRRLRERDKAWSHKTNATPATMDAAEVMVACIAARTRSGALARLFTSGSIDGAQLASAVAIAGVAEELGRDVAVRTASLETRIDAGRRGDGSFFEALGAVRRERAFRRWHDAVGAPIAAVLAMIADDLGLVAVAHRYGIGHRRAKQQLLDALDLWPRIFGDVAKEIDQAALDRAQGRALA